jgi:2-phosphoglycerate kinase
MIYFLGGPPKVGKSLISKTITKKFGINVVSTDSLGAVLENVLDPEVEPGLFFFNNFNERDEVDRINLMVEQTTEVIHHIVVESEVVWKAIKPFIFREKDEGRDVVIEGVAILPEFVNQLENIDYRAVFIGNQGDNHKDNIKKSSKENEHDWLRISSDGYIDAFATFVLKMSSFIENEARKYGFDYIEMDKSPFNDSVDRILDSLFMKSKI